MLSPDNALNTPKRRIKQTESRKKVRHMHELDFWCIKHLCLGGEHTPVNYDAEV